MVGPSPNFNEVPFRGRYDRLSKAAMSGGATITPRATRMVDGAAHTIVIGDPITITFNSAGEFDVLLPATNDPDITVGALGETFTYQYTENFAGGQSFDFELPISYATAGRWLDDVYVINTSPVIPVGGSYATVLELQSLATRVQSLEEGVAASIPNATETVSGKTRYATSTEHATGTSNTTAVTPLGLKTQIDAARPVTATETVSGISRFATQAEATAATLATVSVSPVRLPAATRAQIEGSLIAGTNVTITPANSGATRTFTINSTGGGGTTSAATETAAGIARFSTPSEVDSGTLASTAVSPLRLANKTWQASSITSGVFDAGRIPDLSHLYALVGTTGGPGTSGYLVDTGDTSVLLVTDSAAVLETDVSVLVIPDAKGTSDGTAFTILTGTNPSGEATTDASLLITGILPAARIGDGSIVDAKLASGTALSGAERTKLAGIEALATANRTDTASDVLLAAKAPLASPTFTGTVTIPTPGAGTSAATKAYVDTITANTQAGVTYTLVFNDLGRLVEMSSGAANIVTVPPNTAVPYAIGAVIRIHQLGTGQVTIAAGAGVAIRSRAGMLKISAQYGVVTLRKRATDEWSLWGDLAA